MFFDSSYELIYYVWCIDHECNIVRCDDVFEYVVDDKVHYYLPDFIVNGELTEVKGEHFFDCGGQLQNPFSDDSRIQAQYRVKGELMEYLKVNIVTDIAYYLQYIEKTYGKDFINSCRIRKED